jgi:hypothetical protein
MAVSIITLSKYVAEYALMKKFLQRLFIPQILQADRAQRDTSKTLAKAYEESLVTNLWEDTGRLYFLLDTLKLSFESEVGLVTYERLSVEMVKDILNQIKEGESAAFRQKIVAEQTSEIRISVCGMTWQTLHGQSRTRAITEAAVLRSTTPDFLNSQALFKHADRIIDLDPNILSLPNQVNVFTYDRVSVTDFFSQIKTINTRFEPENKASINLNRENYLAPFSDNEQKTIDTLEQGRSLSQKAYKPLTSTPKV